MKIKRFQTAVVALAMAAITPAAFAQDQDKPEKDKPKAAKPEKKSPGSAPQRGAKREKDVREMRRADDRDDTRRPVADRDKPKDRHPRDSRDGDRRGDEHPRGKEMRTFLGVATSPVHPALREHLDLDDGFGIQVEQVLENSPAGEAGLKESDILILLDDQRLIGPEHLSLLVRSMEPGDKVTLAIIRKGKEQQIDLELGKRAESDFGPVGRGPHPIEPWRESMERNQNYWREWMERNRGSGPNLHEREARGERLREAGPRMPEGRPPAVAVRPGFPVRVFGANGMMQIDNEEGELTICEKDGEHLIVIKNKEGETVHEGEFDPEEGVEGLPEKARDHLKRMKMEDLEVLFRSRPKSESTEETSAPKLPRSGGQPL